MKQWARQEYKWGSVYSPSLHEPRLLVLDAFAAHKKKKEPETAAEVAEAEAQDDFHTELKKLNTTVSMVPPGGTGYVQVCDGFANKKMKELIAEQEEIHYDNHEAEWRAGKYTVSDRRVLLANWVLHAYNELHEKHGDKIIKAFEQVGLSLNPDGSEDEKLKIRDLPSKSNSRYLRLKPS